MRDLRSNITQLMSGGSGIEISGEAPKEIPCLLPTDLWLQLGTNSNATLAQMQ